VGKHVVKFTHYSNFCPDFIIIKSSTTAAELRDQMTDDQLQVGSGGVVLTKWSRQTLNPTPYTLNPKPRARKNQWKRRRRCLQRARAKPVRSTLKVRAADGRTVARITRRKRRIYVYAMILMIEGLRTPAVKVDQNPSLDSGSRVQGSRFRVTSQG